LALKTIHREIRKPGDDRVEHLCEEELAIYLLNNKRGTLADLETRYDKAIHIDIDFEYED